MMKQIDEKFWKEVKELVGVQQAASVMRVAGHPIEVALAVLLGYGKIPVDQH
jgi:hypothetical protein